VIAGAISQSVSVSAGSASTPARLRLTAGRLSPSVDGGRPPGDGASSGEVGAPDAPPDGGAAEKPPAPADGGVLPTWTAPVQVENDPINREFEAVVAVDPARGDAVALFIEKEAQLQAVRYTRATDGWSQPQVIASGARLDNVQVGMDAAGHVFALWTQGGDGVWECRSSDRGLTWTMPARLHATTSAINTSLAAGRNNRARAAWEASVDNHNVMFTAYFDGSAWSAAAMPLASNDFFSTRRASIAVDGNGAGWLAWSQPEPTSPLASARLYLARFTGATLDAPHIVDTDPGSVQPPPVLAMSPDGQKAVVVWQQNYKAGGNDFLASTWPAASGWSAPEKAVVGAGERPDLVMDAAGAATLVYQDILGNGTRNVLVVRREPGKAWSSPRALETSNTAPGGAPATGEEPYPVARADAAGNVWVAWRKGRNATTYGLAAARFAGGQWEPELTIAARENLAVSWPLSLGITDDGRALLVWVYVRGSASAADPDLYSLYAASTR
jgi:hypothetical protein